MKIKTLLLISTLFLCTITSCSPRMVGTWKVTKFETISPGEQNVTLQNIGTITFKGNNKGEKELNYEVMGIKRNDVQPFTWNTAENYITIDSKDSEVAKTWIFIENKKKRQVWKSTDGGKKIQSLVLEKK
ncbi:lipocalin family protein [Cellulophaga sp. Hel_I_12]|uniref:lipocalin family protein n=1 Tax=Cellulophaga sp. Hel_I_12 TaxID=1249972 RepID=UPI0012E0972C|nr:lipocalin family protein [Cellulophaga sp. Hel_I_12]